MTRIKVCKDKVDHFRQHGKRYSAKHLRNRLRLAQDREDEEAEMRILAIIQREKDCAAWRRIRYAQDKEQGRSIREVGVQDEDGNTSMLDTEEGVNSAIWDEIYGKWFYAVESAPICQGKL